MFILSLRPSHFPIPEPNAINQGCWFLLSPINQSFFSRRCFFPWGHCFLIVLSVICKRDSIVQTNEKMVLGAVFPRYEDSRRRYWSPGFPQSASYCVPMYGVARIKQDLCSQKHAIHALVHVKVNLSFFYATLVYGQFMTVMQPNVNLFHFVFFTSFRMAVKPSLILLQKQRSFSWTHLDYPVVSCIGTTNT